MASQNGWIAQRIWNDVVCDKHAVFLLLTFVGMRVSWLHRLRCSDIIEVARQEAGQYAVQPLFTVTRGTPNLFPKAFSMD